MNVSLFLLLFCAVAAASDEDQSNITADSSDDVNIMDDLLLVSTLDGTLHAVSRTNGLVKWQLEDEPIVSVPMDTSVIKGPTFLPNPKDGSLYAFKPDSEGFTKFQFTIPELVQASPCRSTDGILYTGRKEDMWISVNPDTGAKEKIISTADLTENCPGGLTSNLFIGRSEYKITMYDSKTDKLRWNATFKDYSSHAKNEYLVDHKYLHFASSSDGYMVTIDKTSGKVMWANNFGYPVIGMYVHGNGGGLFKVPLMNMAKETLTYMLQNQNGDIALMKDTLQWGPKYSGAETETPLVPSFYVGQYLNNLYAIPAMKHDGVGSRQDILLLPGPSENDIPSSDSTALQVEMAVPAWKLVGYHDLPILTDTDYFPLNQKKDFKIPLLTAEIKPIDAILKDSSEAGVPKPPVFPPEYPAYRHFEQAKLKQKRFQEHKKRQRRPPTSPLRKEHASEPVRWNEITFVAIITSLLTGAIFIIISGKNFQTAFGLDKSRTVSMDGYIRIGQIELDPSDILGRGSEGTVVYKGKFDGRPVAVKRIVPQCFTFADREVALLKESDEHAHVIRYFSTEKDSQFRYIALELCSGTLQEYIENPQFQCSVGLSQITVMEQAMKGIQHLHKLGIVHRDVKPSNILVSFPNKIGQQKIVLSDFGLCKKLVGGRCSFSQRSGMAGTDGWIAPEMILTDRYRMTRAVDIFSMGCVYYYILSGKHPFGDSLTRQARIVAGDFSLKELTAHEFCVEAIDLIQCMLYVEPHLRPGAETVLKHPLFWNSEKKLEFFQDVSDRVEKDHPDSYLMVRLEGNSTNVFGTDWRQNLSYSLQLDLKKFRNYKGDSTRDLLRAMRNKKHHYRDLDAEVKASLGSIPEEFLKYFTSRFPSLLIHTYHSMWPCGNENIFDRYYDSKAGNHLFNREQPYFFFPQNHQNSDPVPNNIWTPPSCKRRGASFPKQMSDIDTNWRANAHPRQSTGVMDLNTAPNHLLHSNTEPNFDNARNRPKPWKASPKKTFPNMHTTGSDAVLNARVSQKPVTSSVSYASMVQNTRTPDLSDPANGPMKNNNVTNLSNPEPVNCESSSQAPSEVSDSSEMTSNSNNLQVTDNHSLNSSTNSLPAEDGEYLSIVNTLSKEEETEDCVNVNGSNTEEAEEEEPKMQNDDENSGVNGLPDLDTSVADQSEPVGEKKTAKKKKIRRGKKKKANATDLSLETQ